MRVLGAGPAGLALACELASRGLAVQVHDPRPGPSRGTSVLSSEDQEHLFALGLRVSGHRIYGLSVRDRGERLAHLSFDELDTPFPWMLAVPGLEALLQARLEELGGEVLWSSSILEGEVDSRPGAVGGRALYQVEGRFGGLASDEAWLSEDEAGVLMFLPLGEGRGRLVSDAPLSGLTELLNLRGPAGCWCEEPGSVEEIEVGWWQARDWTSPWRVGLAAWRGELLLTEPGLADARNLGFKLALVEAGRARAELLDSYVVERRQELRHTIQRAGRLERVLAFRQELGQRAWRRLAPWLGELELVQARVARTSAELLRGYPESPVVGEKRRPMLLNRLGSDSSAETPTWRAWLDFSRGPAPGDRAPDARFGASGRRHLLRQLVGPKHQLLLFDGLADTDEGYRTLSEIAVQVEQRWGELVAVAVVVPAVGRPEALSWDGPVLEDPDFTLHSAFGARSECLVLIRPDGHVGFRSQPADGDWLQEHLEGVFR